MCVMLMLKCCGVLCGGWSVGVGVVVFFDGYFTVSLLRIADSRGLWSRFRMRGEGLVVQ